MTSTSSATSAASAGTPSAALAATVVSTFDNTEICREEWDQFVLRAGGDIYLSYDWCRLWWQFYGGTRQLAIFTFRVQREMVGLVPIFIDRVWLGPVWLRIARVVGSDFGLGLFDPPLDTEWADPACQILLTQLDRRYHCDAVLFNALSGLRTAVGALRRASRTDGCSYTLHQDAVRGPHTLFFLPRTFDEYLAGLDKRQRGNYRRDVNLLQKTLGFRSDIAGADGGLAGDFAGFQQQHAEQWAAEGRLGHFGDWPQAGEFHAALVQAHRALGRVRLVRLIVNGTIAAYQYCYAFGDCLHWFLTARLTGPQWDRFGLGRMGMLKMIETAIAEGKRRIEAGPAHYGYKVQLGGTEVPLHSLLFAAPRWGTRVRVGGFTWLARLLHLVYYKLWFMRLAPRLPLRRRPLWRIWIRSRL